jgi:hypothetical protein
VRQPDVEAWKRSGQMWFGRENDGMEMIEKPFGNVLWDVFAGVFPGIANENAKGG